MYSIESPLSLQIGLGSWQMCHASCACMVLVNAGDGNVSTTAAPSQAMSCWWFIIASAHIQGSPFVSALCALSSKVAISFA